MPVANKPIRVFAGDVLPSQDYLKADTIRFIFKCLREEPARLEELPPTPLVRANEDGKFIAIDGHNLIAVRYFLGQQVEVICAESADDGLPPTSEANIDRNKELAKKWGTALDEQRRVAAEGIGSFADLNARYSEFFPESPAA